MTPAPTHIDQNVDVLPLEVCFLCGCNTPGERAIRNTAACVGPTYGLHEGYVIDELSLGHVESELAVGRALLEHLEVVHHGEAGRVLCLLGCATRYIQDYSPVRLPAPAPASAFAAILLVLRRST